MSTSTVSITANPATARRRPVVVTDKKSSRGIDLVPLENGPNSVVGGDKVNAANSQDLGHRSIRGDAKDLATVKKTAAGNSTVSPLRVRKAPLKPEKPWWLTAISIFTKNVVLLIVILGLVQLIRRLSLQSSGTNPVVLSDFEGRIAEVQGLLKKTSKMIQVQLDVVDKKVESEIGILRSEFSRKIEDKSATLGSELKKLEARTDSLESYLSELKGSKWLTKEQFDSFVENFKKEEGGTGGFSGTSLRGKLRQKKNRTETPENRKKENREPTSRLGESKAAPRLIRSPSSPPSSPLSSKSPSLPLFSRKLTKPSPFSLICIPPRYVREVFD